MAIEPASFRRLKFDWVEVCTMVMQDLWCEKVHLSFYGKVIGRSAGPTCLLAFLGKVCGTLVL